MALNWEIVGNNSKIMAALKEIVTEMGKTAKTFEQEGKKIDETFDEIENGAKDARDSIKETLKQMAAMGGITLGVAGVQKFVSEVINVRKEMQSLHTSFSVLLGDQSKADDMFGQLKEFASTTPYMLNTLASSAQTMLGFGIASDKVVPTLKQIGDVAMGDAQKFQSLSLAFSQISASGKLMGQDLMQMINAGFNPLMEMSRKTGKSIGELKDEMSAGAISADMVADAFKTATEEGGQFYGMTAAMGETLAGKLNTLSGAITDMFNAIGESTEGIINTSVAGLTTIVQNYDKVGKALASIIASYGTYKAAVMLNYAIEMKSAMGASSAAAAIWQKILTTKAATVAQSAYNAVAAMNPYAVLAAAAVLAAGAVWTFAKKTDAATEAQDRMNESLANASGEYEKEESKVRMLEEAVKDNNRSIAARQKAIEELEGIVPGYHASLSKEGELYISNTKAIEQYLNAKKLELKMNAVSDLAQEQMKKKAEAEAKLRTNEEELKKNRDRFARGDVGFWEGFKLSHHDAGLDTENAELKAVIKDAEAALEPYNKMLEETNKELLELKGSQEEVKTQNHDYNYWKNQKEDAEKRLKALTDITGKEKEVQDLKKEIADYDKRMQAYTTTTVRGGATTVKNDGDKIQKIITKQQAEEKKLRLQLIRDTEQAVINQYEDGQEKRLAQIDLNYNKEVDAIEEWYENIKVKKIEAARQLWEADKKNAGKTFDASSVNAEYTEEEKKAYDERKKAAVHSHEEAVKAEHEADRQYMYQYLQEYGTLQEKREAINAEYEEKIRKARAEGHEWEVKDYEKKWKVALYNLDKEEFKKTDVYKKMSNELSDMTMKQIDKMRQESEAVLKAMKEGTYTEDETTGRRSRTFTYNNKTYTIDEEEYNNWRKQVEGMRTKSEELKDAFIVLWKSISGNSEYGWKDASGAIGKIGSMISELSGSIGNMFASWGDNGSAEEIDYIGRFGSGLSEIAQGINDGDIVSTIKGAAELVTTVSDIFKADYSDYDKLVEKMTLLKDVWAEILDYKMSYIQDSWGVEAVKAADEARRALDAQLSVIKEMAKARLESGASVGSHSKGYRTWELFKDVTKEVEQSIGATFTSAYDLLDMNAEQLRALMEAYPDRWARMDKDVRGYLEQMIELEGKGDQISSMLVENLTKTSFESLMDSFKSTLMDMNADAKTFADNFSKMMMQSALESRIDEVLGKQLEDWQNEWANRMNDGNLSDQDILDLRVGWTDENGLFHPGYDGLVEQGQQLRDQIADITGYGAESGIVVADFSSIRDGFKDLVKDLNSTTEDFASHFAELMYNAILDQRINESYNQQMQEWYDNYKKAAKDGITEDEMAELRRTYEEITKAMQSEAEEIAQLTGYGKQLMMEKMTGTTVESLKSDFDNLVMSFDATAKDFADNFAKYMQDALKKARLDPMLEDGLNEWYDQFYEFMRSNGELTEQEIETLREKYMSLAQDAQQQAEEIARITGTWEAQMREKAMGTSLDSFKSNFLNMLSSLDGSSEEFADNFSKMMYDALINSQIESAFGTKMKALYEKMADFLMNGGDVASDEYQTLLDEYIALGNEASDMAEDLADKLGIGLDKLRDKFTQTSYSSVRSEFESLLMNMDSSSNDFAEKFTEHLQKAIINAQMSNLLDDQLKAWYKNFAAVMEDGNLSDEELNDLRTEYDAIVEDALKQREALANITGYGKGPYSQSGTSAFQGMSQNTGDELNGRFTALQISGESIESNTSLIAAQMSEIGMQMQAFVNASQILQQTVGEITNMLVFIKSNQDDLVSGSINSNAMMSRKLDAIANKLSRL